MFVCVGVILIKHTESNQNIYICNEKALESTQFKMINIINARQDKKLYLGLFYRY